MNLDWQEAYEAAILETDHGKLVEKIDRAIKAIRQGMVDNAELTTSDERQRLQDALRTLTFLRRIELQITA